MSRLEQTFGDLRSKAETGLVAYVTAGDPDIRRSEEIVVSLDRAGASVIEIGVPFSDPVADGPVIQRAAARALASGTTLARVLELAGRLRSRVRAPLVLFSYLNPIVQLGLDSFVRRAADSGLDGVLVLDLPLEEAGAVHDGCAARGLDQIFLIAPTTSRERIRRAAALGSGFLYGISRLGVTGARASLSTEAAELAGRIRAESRLPLAIGFGVSHPDHVREVGRWADAAVVGSSIVAMVEREAGGRRLVESVEDHVRWLMGKPAADRRGES
jgi:tryptophan synthase alpha chain